ncbi:MAG: hypothetical protein K8R89_03520, partial [Anaerolineae bacterium]|nr:hypothetical protein [Anaerolineae bacterium]
IAGFVLVFPDVASALRKAKGRLWPFGWFYLWREFKSTRRFLGNGIGLLPQYQGVGANAVLYTELMETMQARGADFLEVAYVAESNVKSLSDMSALNVNWYKRHRIYHKARKQESEEASERKGEKVSEREGEKVRKREGEEARKQESEKARKRESE